MSTSNPVFINQSFTDFEFYQHMAMRWNLDFKKISKGSFFGALRLLDMGNVQIGETKLSGTILQHGLTPLGYRSFVLPVHVNQNFRWFNQLIDRNQMMIFPQNNTLDAISYENFDVYILSIKEEYLAGLIEKYKYGNLNEKLKSEEQVFQIDKHFHRYINSYIALLLQRIEKNPNLRYSDIYNRNVTLKLPEKILNYLNRKELNSNYVFFSKRDILILKAIEYINKNQSKRLMVSKLSKELGVTERTLEYGFKERFFVSPLDYIKAVKLNQVRKELIHNNKQVIQIAPKFGFTHMGQFSADYKALFGELPSETINK